MADLGGQWWSRVGVLDGRAWERDPGHFTAIRGVVSAGTGGARMEYGLKLSRPIDIDFPRGEVVGDYSSPGCLSSVRCYQDIMCHPTGMAMLLSSGTNKYLGTYLGR